ncbi:AAA family ATPase [Nostoc sp. FACHB-87]|uniref:ATP-dependent nuclease n=1 Tax=Nostocaceae TaxID=1162 RepID=UPI0016829DB1|nr:MULTISPECIES: ATP-binding protein [Nostocaceae]MBD2457594.1 AAA family ATPase [Nostoc sp. FACHB-87]MBD2477511.1 AAA family ATPase [Anabaena sp. FACHB-83]
MLKKLEIIGLRGFATLQTLYLAQAGQGLGSGLTILVGANNTGKSTVIEALRALVQQNPNPNFTQGKRNRKAGDMVKLRITDNNNKTEELRTVNAGSSETERDPIQSKILNNLLILPSRRTLYPYFQRAECPRSVYMAQVGFPTVRTSVVDQFASRLFTAQKNQSQFNEVLKKVLNPVPSWTIDQTDNGDYYLKIKTGGADHSSEGLGEGLVSLLYIVDALYDSNPGDVIVIDEPELSLHPSLQRKLATLLTEYATERQIILSTHSPYFLNLEALKNGATVARIYLKNGESVISQLSPSSAKGILPLLTDKNNPHILGLNAQEVFFLEDKIILVEGQEDVIFYQFVQQQINVDLNGTFFGWGIGGAEKMAKIAGVLHDLGFTRVVGILDGNRNSLVNDLSKKFPNFHFFAIPADDVRTKPERQYKAPVIGLLDDNKNIRTEYKDTTYHLFIEANNYLSDI